MRAVRKRRQLVEIKHVKHADGREKIYLFSTVRNEITRLPFFLDHYRAQGVRHFFFVDNDSDDGTTEMLCDQPDVSVWRTHHSYKLARFGMDWLTWLMMRHAHGHWCVTVDADELLVYPDSDQRHLCDLTRWLDENNRQSFGAVMLDLYPKGRIANATYRAGQDPTLTLNWFDAGNYHEKYQPALQNLLIRGGVRGRVFFATQPDKAPTLSKTPLVKWNRRYAYVSSTHSLLPRRLNAVRGATAVDMPSGVLLHTKFLDLVIEKSREEKTRQQHFENSALYQPYYDNLIANPDLWSPQSVQYKGPAQFLDLGLMSRGNWR